MNLFSPRERILVADDDKDICLYLKRYLERRRYTVAVVFDGDDAKSLIEKSAFDYILLDCSMPNLTGLELIGTARRRNPKAKIVLISAFPSVNEDIVQRLGGDTFIHKPIQLSEIDKIFEKEAGL